ncbi:MAG TPA: glycerol-3-phosphate acyltransferase, partial [Acidobacteria bacterium]|nr:glycerol-3-phosphate acyltransferase [Acidobacteriota bacterium]
MAAKFIVTDLSYLLGSIPFSFLLTRMATDLAVRYLGSGNTILEPRMHSGLLALVLGLVVVVLDAMKGALAVTLSAEIDNHEATGALSAMFVAVGHLYPVWLKFDGGKGVSTAGGGFAVVPPVSTLVGFVCFIGTVPVTRFVSLGSTMATFALALMLAINGESANVLIAGFAVFALIVFRHRGNIGRLALGSERRLTSWMPVGGRNVI